MNVGTSDAMMQLVLGLSVLLALASAATAIFVTRFEHRDVVRRVARIEERHDREDDAARRDHNRKEP